MQHLKIRLHPLRNAEYLQYLKDYLQITATHDPTLLHVLPSFTALSDKVAQIEAVLKQDTGSPLTVEIESLDLERDSHLGGIYTAIYGLTSHYDADKKAAALLIEDRLKVYGTASQISIQSLQGETATIDNMIHDLQTLPDLSAALTTLGLTDWVAELKSVNIKLNTKYLERTAEIAALNPDKLKVLRQEANPLYYQLRDMLMAQALVAGYPDPFPTTINELNALTQQYNHMLLTREGRLGEEEDGDTPTDDTDF